MAIVYSIPALTYARLHTVVDYDPSTGLFTWKVRPLSEFKSLRACLAWNGRNSGKTAGHKNKIHGYIEMSIDSEKLPAHRVAWLYMSGVWPTLDIDHLNGVRHDNRISNLRVVSRAVNLQNVRGRGARSGFTGVGRVGRKFAARICIDYRNIHLGYFETAEEAHATYLSKKREIHPGCAF